MVISGIEASQGTESGNQAQLSFMKRYFEMNRRRAWAEVTIPSHRSGVIVPSKNLYLDTGQMVSFRWTRHRVVDASGNDKKGHAAISMWWVARAAAEETLQGSPFVSAWLKLFRTHLSTQDDYWLRWRGDLAESTELRRAYSGLYGRFFARALLTHHLGFTRFHSLKRNGLEVKGSVKVKRTNGGDIPDWLAWDDQHSSFVLCEAKGSLTARDFLSPGTPKCVGNGKDQFDRVETCEGGRTIHPARWVAATRWATEDRKGEPTTILWDLPVEDTPFDEEEATRHRAAMTHAWLNSIAPGMGWTGANDILSKEREREALNIRAEPGPIPESIDWHPFEDEPEVDIPEATTAGTLRQVENARRRELEDPIGELRDSTLYADLTTLLPPVQESYAHEQPYIVALITRFGIRPVRTLDDIETMQRAQESARNHEEPAMLVGIPFGIDLTSRTKNNIWLDGAGIAQTGNLAVFDLRQVTFDPLERSR